MSSICRSGEPTKTMWGKTLNRLVEQQLHMEAETQDASCPGPVESPPNQFIMEVAAVESLELEVFRSKGHSGNKIHPGVHLSRKLSSTEQKCDTAADYQDGIVAEPPQRGGTTSPYLDP